MIYSKMDRNYLYEEYHVKKRSMDEIAQDNNTYKSRVRRLIVKYNIPIRNKSESQKISLERGRHPHPTFGKSRSNETKNKIGDGLHAAWGRLSPEERTKRVEFYKRQWQLMTPEEKKKFHDRASQAVRLTARYGSKLERFIVVQLRTLGYNVVFHAERALEREGLEVDIMLPDDMVAIEVDGPSHFLPIWGDEKLQKNIERDSTKNGLLMQSGFIVIRIKYLSRNVSKKLMRELVDRLAEVLKTTDRTPRIIELGV